MATVGLYEMTDSWSSGVTTYNSIRMTVTDTGSSSNSNYLCVGGSSGTFKISKYGYMISNDGYFGVMSSKYATFGGRCISGAARANVMNGCYNTMFGDSAGYSTNYANYATYFGAFAGYGITSGLCDKYYTTLIGYAAGTTSHEQYQTSIGALAATTGTQGQYATSIGYKAASCGAAGYGRTTIGALANGLQNITATSGSTTIGYYAGANATSSHSDVIIGAYAYCNNTSGNSNVVVGNNAGGTSNASATAPFLNVYVGNGAGCGQAGDYNTYVGWRAGGLCTMDTSCNTFIGMDTGLCNTVNNQIAVGKSAKPSNTANHTVWGNSSNNNTNCVYAAWSNVSDCRDKTEISSLTDNYGLPFIQKLKPVSYKWDNRDTYVRECKFEYGCRDGSLKGEKDNYGFIAQDIKETIEDLGISFDALGYSEEQDAYRLTYEDMIAPLTLAVQQLSKRVDVLETKKWAVNN